MQSEKNSREWYGSGGNMPGQQQEHLSARETRKVTWLQRGCCLLNIWDLLSNGWYFMDISHLVFLDKCGCFWLLVVKSQLKLDYVEKELAQISNRGEQDLVLVDPVA